MHRLEVGAIDGSLRTPFPRPAPQITPAGQTFRRGSRSYCLRPASKRSRATKVDRALSTCQRVPAHVPEIAVDPGGFVAATHGGYRFSWAAYEVWLARLGPRLSWAAFPDLPCEQSLAPLEVQVRARQEQTLRWAWELWGGHDDTENWEVHRAHTWSYVVTVQGRTVDQYVRHAEQLAPLVAQQFDHYHYTAYA